MITIVIVVTIFVTIGIIISIKRYDSYLGMMDVVFRVIISLLFGIMAGVILSLIVGLFIPVEFKRIETEYNIVSLNDGQGMEGDFFLGCGQIESKMKYTFYYQKDDFFKLKQIHTYKAIIKYSDSNPKAIYFEYEFDFSNVHSLFSISAKPSNGWVIYVPKGTIKNGYNLDAD